MAANSIPPAPADTAFEANGRITLPWRAWLNTVTQVGATVASLSGDYLSRALNLSDLANVVAARTNLGLGSAATHEVSDFDAAGAASTAQAAAIAASDPVGSATSAVGAIPSASASVRGLLTATDWSTFNGKQNALGYTPLNPANNLSEVTPATARTNLGLGSGLSVTVALAKITTGGANGSITFVNGLLTAKVDPT